MRTYERMQRYIQVNTTSDPTGAEVQPSSACQFDLANMLVDEMKDIGITDARMDERCYVYGSLPATPGCESAPALGFIAHIDTSPAFSGENVKPILHENYDGGDVHLPNGRIIPVSTFPLLTELRGQTLITASGDTLLGVDDKAGIAEILTACEQLIEQGLPHGKLCIAFTPDEEIGAGANGFDVAGFGAKYAYTVDGGAVGGIDYENFNAAGARLVFHGVGVHPGSAKNIMVNALKLAMEFASLLPADECPERTEGREGFYHIEEVLGTVDRASMQVIIRDHERAAFEARKAVVEEAVATMRHRHGADSVDLTLADSYYNMGEVIRQHYHLVENAGAAIRKAGLEPTSRAVRGGTDGSRLSFMGLPCPNLGTGGYYAHGPNECATVEGLDKSVEILVNIVGIYAHTTE